jgi:hypothetical protein
VGVGGGEGWGLFCKLERKLQAQPSVGKPPPSIPSSNPNQEFSLERTQPNTIPPEHVNIRTPDSAATALARRVLPVPGAPASSTPPILEFHEYVRCVFV